MTNEPLCKASVYHSGMFRPGRCSRKSTADGYCKQHHPETIAAKHRDRNAKWNAEYDARRSAEAARKAKIARLIELSCEEARQIIAELNLM